MSKTSLANERQVATRELQSNLTKLGLHQVSSIKLYYEDWYGKFELKEATFVAIRTTNVDTFKAISCSRSIWSLAMDLVDTADDQEFYSFL